MRRIIQAYKQHRFYKKVIGPGHLCFDVGANNGSKTKLFLSLGANVIAFEPQSACQPKLNKLKKKYPDFTCYQLALGAKKEQVQLHLATHTEVATLSEKFMDYFGNEEIFWPETEEASMTTLDQLIEEHGLPHFCKIDSEGWELEIFRGLHHAIPMIEFEFTGGFVQEAIQCVRLLSKLGPYQFNYIMNEIPVFASNRWLSSDEIIERVDQLPVPRLHGNIFASLQ